jgi:hypothetical protein
MPDQRIFLSPKALPSGVDKGGPPSTRPPLAAGGGGDEMIGAIDEKTGRPFSSEFMAMCERVAEQDGRHKALLAATARGDEGVTPKMVAEAEALFWELANEGAGILQADRGEAEQADTIQRTEEVIAAPESAAVALAVSTLLKRGPMTAGEIEALRLPGLSHNAVRPILRIARERGLVERRQSGRRVLWVAIPQ